MISGWAVAGIILFVLLFGVVIVMQMRIITQNEIIIRAIPFGSPRVQERQDRRAAPIPSEQVTRPVGATPASTGRHA